MAINPWIVPAQVFDLIQTVKQKHHLPRLTLAEVSGCFIDAKPFVKNKINFGKVTKFSPFSKIWFDKKVDFGISIPIDLWQNLLLKPEQKEAYIDLQLSRCAVQYVPETCDVNGKKKAVTDDYGRIQYTDQIKVDDDGNPKWYVDSLDLEVFTQNVSRYGLWFDSLIEFGKACQNA